MDDRTHYRRKAQEALLDIFTSATNLPIGLYEVANNHLIPIFTERSIEKYEPHCVIFQSVPGGKEKCQKDQCNRAKNAVKSKDEQLTLCHAGMYNQAIPVVVNNSVRAVVLFGEMQIDDPTKMGEALATQEKTLEELGVSSEIKIELRNALLNSKRYSQSQLQIVLDTLPRIAEWYYLLFEEEDRQSQYVDTIIHDLQTRLQSIVGDAENLYLDFNDLKSSEIKNGINAILSNAEALSTLINNLGDFQAEYRFEKLRLLPLLVEAKRIYSTEANERNIHVSIDLEPLHGESPVLNLSKSEIQLAFNNLIHNAVKYSFRGRPDHPRVVRIQGTIVSNQYVISIENYGVGITPEEINQRIIFRDGYQGILTEGEFRTGSGKGLCFTEKIIKGHGGRIEAASRLLSDDQDARRKPHLNTFTVFLPIHHE